MVLPDVGVLLVVVGVATSVCDFSVFETQAALDEGDGSGVQVLGRTGIEGDATSQSVAEGLTRNDCSVFKYAAC